LATVTELARAGCLRLFPSFELGMERMSQAGQDAGYVGLDLLEDIEIGSVRSPVGRTVVFSAFEPGVALTKDEQMDFFRSICDHRFREIAGAVGDAHVDDAFHLWSAEVADLDSFLTMDRRFLNAIKQQGRKAR